MMMMMMMMMVVMVMVMVVVMVMMMVNIVVMTFTHLFQLVSFFSAHSASSLSLDVGAPPRQLPSPGELSSLTAAFVYLSIGSSISLSNETHLLAHIQCT